MKKLLLFGAAALIAATPMAAKVQLYLGDKPVEPGNIGWSPAEWNNDNCEDWEDGIFLYKFMPPLTMMSDKATELDAVAEAYNGQYIEFCLGGACHTSPKEVVNNFQLAADKKEEVQFHYSILVVPEALYEDMEGMADNMAMNTLPSDIKTTLTITEQGGQPQVYNFFFNPKEEGGVSIMPTDSDTTSAVYSLNGVKVADNANALPAGIYIFKTGTKTDKIIVK